MADSGSDVENNSEFSEHQQPEQQITTSSPVPDESEPNFDILQLNEEIPELVGIPTHRRRRNSSTSSVSSVALSSQGMPSKIDMNTPLEDLLFSLRKIVNSTTSPVNAKTKPKPRLTITLQQLANSILDCLEERKEAFEACKNTHQEYGPQEETLDSATQTDQQPSHAEQYQEVQKAEKEAQTEDLPQTYLKNPLIAEKYRPLPEDFQQSQHSRHNHPFPPLPLSYAEAARTTILIYPKEGSKDKSLRQLLQKEVNPLEDNINIKEVRNLRNKGLAIDLASEEQAEKLISKLNNKEELQTSVEARKYARKNPRCIIYDVPTDTREEELKRAIEVATGQEASCYSLSFRTKERNGRSHCVVQATPKAFTALLQIRKLSLGWTRHSVREHINIKRCYKCQSFGHLQRECKRRNYYCAFCGFEHHTSACNSRAPCCANCWEENSRRKAGFRVDHPADATCCSVYQREVLKYKRTIQYRE
ncbi:hypothetical protein AVEN_22746-1 [Araneus ventricosus]|uniref:CCHC-type domain-containing protein n=1 Tax=Araneus ventricosus TaxID=182803 RepID=A0A4Y2VSX5_ARAVE|nr:hypothetical protein AVEN_22746-1 [Araneus ventricosus]